MSDAEDLLHAALALPDRERLELAINILHTVGSIDPHAGLDDEALAAELARRADEVATGKAKTLAWEDVRERVRKRVRSARRRSAGSARSGALETFHATR